MKNLDSEEIFKLFSQGDEQVYHDNGVQDILDTPFVLFGTVIRGVYNYFTIDTIYSYKYGKQYDSVSDSIKMKYFAGLLKYLERIDISNLDTVNELLDQFEPQEVHSALQQLLNFYEKKEMYEKCSFIFKFYDIFSVK